MTELKKVLNTKLNKKKGFTLAELLVVVAIIGVLVAVSIPVFGGALNKAAFEADAANVRAAYAEALVTKMISDVEADKTVGTYTISIDDAVATNGSTVEVVSGDIKVSRGDDLSVIIPVDDDVTVTIS